MRFYDGAAILDEGLLMLAPIALFTYNRPWHTRQTVEALARNPLAADSDLVVFSDAAAAPDKAAGVAQVRDYLASVTGFRSVRISERLANYGLAKSIIAGVTDILKISETVIVLEDDMVTSPFFLTYMNESLGLYAPDEGVASVHGYMYPVNAPLPETFFIRGADCWGWATWARAWKHFNPNGQELLVELQGRGLARDFDFDNSYPYTEMLRDQIAGRNDSWAILWYASAFLRGMLTLYPAHSLVRNIGMDGTGVHCGVSDDVNAELSGPAPVIERQPIVESLPARRAMTMYFKRQYGGVGARWRRRFGAILSRLTHQLLKRT